jgi:hypothetical protein
MPSISKRQGWRDRALNSSADPVSAVRPMPQYASRQTPYDTISGLAAQAPDDAGRLATNWPARWLIVVRNGSHACLFPKPEPAHAWRGDEDKGPGDSRAICSFLVRMSSRQGAWGTCLE